MESASTSLQGSLLVASPALVDPNFRRAVVLVTAHTEEGAMGLVLNRPSEISVAAGVPDLARFVEDDALVHVGGPVEPSAVVALAELDDPSASPALVFGDVGFIPVAPDSPPVRARVFAGYAGWGPLQLEAELGEEAWIVEPADADDVFAVSAEELWAVVLRRKGGSFAVLALMPADPSLN